jgi:hypothetical protein
MVDARVGRHGQEAIPAGEAVAGMFLNGVGVSDRPVTFTPQFVANTPLALLWREGVDATMCNRVQRGRTLEEAPA